MAIANFEDFCKGFCEIAGIAAPELVPDRWGTLAFSMRIRDAAVTVLQVSARPDTAYAMAELGPMPEHHAHNGWGTLMDANKSLHGMDSPVFSRNPETGDVVLQQSLPFTGFTVAGLFGRMETLTDMACRWPQEYLLAQALIERDSPHAAAPVWPTALA